MYKENINLANFKEVTNLSCIKFGYITEIKQSKLNSEIDVLKIGDYQTFAKKDLYCKGMGVFLAISGTKISLLARVDKSPYVPLLMESGYQYEIRETIKDGYLVNSLVIGYEDLELNQHISDISKIDIFINKFSQNYGSLMASSYHSLKFYKSEQFRPNLCFLESEITGKTFLKSLSYDGEKLLIWSDKNDVFVEVKNFKYKVLPHSFLYDILSTQNIVSILKQNTELILQGLIMGPNSISNPFSQQSDKFYLTDIYDLKSRITMPIHEQDVLVNNFKRSGSDLCELPSLGFHTFIKSYSQENFINDIKNLKENFPYCYIEFKRLDSNIKFYM